MLKTRRSRGIAAGVAAGLSLILVCGLLGYFIGFEGYGDKWEGFYLGVMVACSSLVGGAIFMGVIILTMNWIYKGKSREEL